MIILISKMSNKYFIPIVLKNNTIKKIWLHWNVHQVIRMKNEKFSWRIGWENYIN